MRTSHPLPPLDGAFPALRASLWDAFSSPDQASSHTDPLLTAEGLQLSPLAGLGPPMELAGTGVLTLSPTRKEGKISAEEHSSLGTAKPKLLEPKKVQEKQRPCQRLSSGLGVLFRRATASFLLL